jgi:fucose permease
MAYRRRLVFAAACLGMLLFGVTLTTLGAVLPSLIPRYGLDRASGGTLLSLMSLSILAASLVFGPIVDRYGYKWVLIAGALGVMLGLEAIAFATSGAQLAAAVLLFGFSGGIINGSTNALASDISEQGRGSGLALLGVFFGVGAFGVPLVLGLLLRSAEYRTVLASLGVLVLLPLSFFFAIRFPPAKQPQGLPIRQAGALLGEGPLLLLSFMLFFQSGMEITMGGWSGQFVHEALGLGEARSVLVLSLFWIGMMAARLTLARLLRQRASALVLGLFMACAGLGSLLLLTCDSERVAMAGLFLIGYGLAAGFPVVLGAIGEIYSELTGTAFSIAFVVALLGGSALPYLTGVLGDRFGLRASLLTVPVALVMMAVLLILACRPGRPTARVLTKWKEVKECTPSNG